MATKKRPKKRAPRPRTADHSNQEALQDALSDAKAKALAAELRLTQCEQKLVLAKRAALVARNALSQAEAAIAGQS